MRRALAFSLLLALAACQRESALRVALDVPDAIADTLLREFGTANDLQVDVQKTGTGKPCGDCDVVWSRDLASALALGLSPLPDGDYGRPPSMVDAARLWVAGSAVARVIIYDPAQVSEAEAPISILQLGKPELARRLVMADPTHGDAAWQSAALLAALGDARAVALYRDMAGNGARVVADEDAVVAALLAGERSIALTNSDRAFAAQATKPTLVISVPDQANDGLGAVLIPTVVGITSRAADSAAARRLVDFILSTPVARQIAMTTDSILVLSDPGETPAGILSILKLRVMPIAYTEVAKRLPSLGAALGPTAS